MNNTIALLKDTGGSPTTINRVDVIQDSDTTYIDINAVMLKTDSGIQQVYGKPCSVKIENSTTINGTDISGLWGETVTLSYTIDVPSSYTVVHYDSISWDSPVYLDSEPANMVPGAVWQGPGMYSSGYASATNYAYIVVVKQDGAYYDEYYQSGFYQSTITLSEPQTIFSATASSYADSSDIVDVYGGRAEGFLYIDTASAVGGWHVTSATASGNSVPAGTTYIQYDLEAEYDPVGAYASKVNVVLLDENGYEVDRSKTYYRPDGGGLVAEMATLEFEMPQYTTTVTLKVVSADS